MKNDLKEYNRGKVCMITGATNGIGLAAASALAELGMHVLIVSRSPEKCEAVAAQLRQASGNPLVEAMPADLSSQADIRRLAQTFHQRFNRLDVLVNNAGGYFGRLETSVDGIEKTWALNHMAYFYLTHLLLDTLKASAPARIINVSSNAHQGAVLNFDDLQSVRAYFGFISYSRSKLANVLFTYELARRLEGSGVTVNAMHPGMVMTGIWNGTGRLAGIINLFMRRIALTPEEGAKTIIYLASDPAVEGVTGKYFANERAVPTNTYSYRLDAAQKLWEVSAQACDISNPEGIA